MWTKKFISAEFASMIFLLWITGVGLCIWETFLVAGENKTFVGINDGPA